ncbi:MAG: glycosyltransferase family 39 protein, partial [Candidatus Binatia bacterium]
MQRPDEHPARATQRLAVIAVAALTVVALLLRFSTLGRSLWLDEAWRANIALAPSWPAFWSDVLGSGGGKIGAPMPPIFVVVLRAIGLVTGHSAVGMRLLPLAASIAAVPIAYVVGRRAAGTAAGLVAALCLTAAPAALLHGQELKQYSVDVTVVLTLLLATSAVAASPSTWRAWLVLAGVQSLAPGLAYPAALVLPGTALATLSVCRGNDDRKKWLVAQTISALAALAWYALVIGPQRERPRVLAYWAGDFPPLDQTLGPAWFAGQLRDFVVYACGQPAWLAAAVTVVGLVCAARWLGLAALGTLATALAAAAWRIYPLSAGRATVFLLPFVYLGLAAACGRMRTAIGAVLALLVAVTVIPLVGRGLVHPAAALVYEETEPLIAAIERERRPNDRVYVYDGAVPAFRFRHPAADPAIVLGSSRRTDNAAYATEIRPLVVPGTRVWVLFAHVFVAPSGQSERDVILGELALYGRQVDAREAPGASLHLFEITRAPGTVKHL